MPGYKESRFLTKSSFRALVKGLLADYEVFGTVRRDGLPAFGHIESFEELVLFDSPTHISAKEFVFPQRERLLEFKEGPDGELVPEAVVEARDQAIIGMHACDVRGMSLMDRVFSYGVPDANYLGRRERTVVVATGCTPDKFCFCDSLDTGSVADGFDIFIERLPKGFLVRTGTPRGARLLKRYAKTRKATAAELRALDRQLEERARSFSARLEAPPEELPRVYSESAEHPVWERIGKVCYGCGACNHVCPTCYCFDVKDELRTDLKSGERVRVWDGCTLVDFAKVAGGHNFRPSRAERLRHRFNRKFNYLSDRFSSLFCIGCGRCSRTCLVDISISEVTNELVSDRKKR